MTSRDVDSNNCPKQTCKISAGWNPGVIDPGGIGNPRNATRKSASVRIPRNWDLLTVGVVIRERVYVVVHLYVQVLSRARLREEKNDKNVKLKLKMRNISSSYSSPYLCWLDYESVNLDRCHSKGEFREFDL